jgi:hydrogenase expression/formation protein HypE
MSKNGTVLLAHGGGGTLMADLIQSVFRSRFCDPILNAADDAAVLEGLNERLAFTTDAFVVTPIFFPGGDIGKLAVCGTVNDLAAQGARPLFLSAAFVLEEGLPLEELEKVADSMAETARPRACASSPEIPRLCRAARRISCSSPPQAWGE